MAAVVLSALALRSAQDRAFSVAAAVLSGVEALLLLGIAGVALLLS